MFPKGKRIPLFLTLVALFWFSMYTYSPIFTVYIKGFSSTQMAGTIIASYGFVQMCLRIPIGILSDNSGVYERMSVYENMKLFADLRGLPASRIDGALFRRVVYFFLAAAGLIIFITNL